MKQKTVTVFILIVAMVGNALTRQWSEAVRGEPIVAASRSGRSLSGMNSYALALLLGGLRGPLVMFLWSTSEAQKNENNLEDFDSKVEWIRLLQPEFDSVHLFQIWNKAFNISVKMTNLSNKYTTILDALQYAHDVDAEKPNDLNIVAAMGDVYFNKLGYSENLGNNTERRYFDDRVRADSLPRTNNLAGRRESAVRHTRLDPMLDKDFNLLPDYTQARLTPPLVMPDNASVTYDGSELQYLHEFQPFPYGVSPMGVAYNYYRRAQMLLTVGKQHHWFQSDLVTDSRPAVALTYWASEEAEAGRRAELAAIGKPVAPTAETSTFEMTASDIPLTSPIVDRAAYNQALYRYNLTATLDEHADAAFLDHIARYQSYQNQNYVFERDTVRAAGMLYRGDLEYLKAMTAEGDQRAAHIAQATKDYTLAATLNRLVILQFSIDEGVATATYPPGVTRRNISADTPNLDALTQKAVAAMESTPTKKNFLDDAQEYLQGIDRATIRLKMLEQAANPAH